VCKIHYGKALIVAADEESEENLKKSTLLVCFKEAAS